MSLEKITVNEIEYYQISGLAKYPNIVRLVKYLGWRHNPEAKMMVMDTELRHFELEDEVYTFSRELGIMHVQLVGSNDVRINPITKAVVPPTITHPELGEIPNALYDEAVGRFDYFDEVLKTIPFPSLIGSVIEMGDGVGKFNK